MPSFSTSPVSAFPYGPFYKSTRYYTGIMRGGSTGSSTITANKLYAFPFPVGKTTIFDRIAIDVSLLGPAGTCRLGVYQDTGSEEPGELELDAGTIDTSSGGNKNITIDLKLVPGLYWLAIVSNDVPNLNGLSGNVTWRPFGEDALTSGTWGNCYVADYTFGALPATFPSATIDFFRYVIFMRAK